MHRNWQPVKISADGNNEAFETWRLRMRCYACTGVYAPRFNRSTLASYRCESGADRNKLERKAEEVTRADLQSRSRVRFVSRRGCMSSFLIQGDKQRLSEYSVPMERPCPS